jgi:hypothetical protein
MFGLHLTLQATAALTMRVLPSGILDIISYPFVPPTTLSGWLRRVWMLAEGYDLPETSAAKNAPYYVLPPEIISLGAYPKRSSYIHKTKRKGVKDFSDTSFTRLVFDKDTGPTFQLHTWEYLTTDKLNGYVVSEDKDMLERLHNHLVIDDELRPWGCKLGKEGFAYLADISGIQKLEQREDTLQPLTLLAIDTVINQSKPIDFAVHNIHRFAWGKGITQIDTPSPVKGYDSLPMALTENGQLATSWWYAPNMHFPVGLETVLEGVHDV